MEDYTGFREIVLSDENANDIYAKPCPNIFGCLPNEYLIVRDPESGEPVETLRCTGEFMKPVQFRPIRSTYGGEVKPRNVHQKLAIDMLFNPASTVKVLTGPFGSGKDLLMINAALELIEKKKFEKIVYVRNNVEVQNSRPIGYLPGTKNDKLRPWIMPFADHVGGEDGMADLAGRGVIEIAHLGFMRGRDIRNSLIYCTEGENLTRQHVQLLIGRVAEGSELWINGDLKQCDGRVFAQDNGLTAAVEKLKGNPLFSHVRLMKTERSETAALADLLD